LNQQQSQSPPPQQQITPSTRVPELPLQEVNPYNLPVKANNAAGKKK